MFSDDEGEDELASSDDSDDGASDADMKWSDLFAADDTETGDPVAPKKKQDILLDKEK